MKNVVTEVRPGTAPVHLPSLMAFECVARHMNFGRAAAELAVTPTAMSKTVKQLEAQLGVRLFHRTTRSVALTESGAQLLTSLAPALAQIRSAVTEAGDSSSKPWGTLRINSSFVAYATLIEPHLPKFLAHYPDLRLEVRLDNTLADIVGAGFDAGIRLGHALQRDMIAVPLGPAQRLIVVGSPAYLARHTAPKTPKDLLQHDCIQQRLPSSARLLGWEFKVGTRPLVIDVQGRLVFDEMHVVLAAARSGCGLAFVFRQFASADLESGALVGVLDKYCPPEQPFHLYYPSRLHKPGKLKAFIEFFQAANWSTPK